ncbi:enoyl-acyl carrier protein reductase FabMG [Bdellovibrio sp. HCB337]|uniref:enoyl ACP reductase FabMG family protein n=1 Tax=Bdellovibrio sp. HCB337 TaxID=3394358 RepID=UPI0039A6B940
MNSAAFLKKKPELSPYKKGDVLVLFGELFQRGYANGLVEEAEARGMTIVRATVGRRDAGVLRPLNTEESQNIPKPFINVPLEAGFDLEPDSQGHTPIDQLKDVKLSDWESAKLDFKSFEESRQKGITRFRQNTEKFLKELEQYIPKGANVLFAHLMAGGVPRTKIVMPLMNRTCKGSGDRYLASEQLWNSDIGKLCSLSFNEVTAETLRHLLDLSAPLRAKLEAQGGHVAYTAYGYHGTEILINDQYKWQTYTPYIQGWAKLNLEKIAIEAHKKGISVCVYNCPEILTNSSSIFQGVEVSLYPLVRAVEKECGNTPAGQKIVQDCKDLLKDGHSLADILKLTDTYFTDSEIKAHCVFEKWPQHSSKTQLETMLKCSEDLIALHKDEKKLITFELSEVVFKSCGYVMLHGSWKPQNPVAWIGHDIVARCIH